MLLQPLSVFGPHFKWGGAAPTSQPSVTTCLTSLGRVAQESTLADPGNMSPPPTMPCIAQCLLLNARYPALNTRYSMLNAQCSVLRAQYLLFSVLVSIQH